MKRLSIIQQTAVFSFTIWKAYPYWTNLCPNPNPIPSPTAPVETALLRMTRQSQGLCLIFFHFLSHQSFCVTGPIAGARVLPTLFNPPTPRRRAPAPVLATAVCSGREAVRPHSPMKLAGCPRMWISASFTGSGEVNTVTCRAYRVALDQSKDSEKDGEVCFEKQKNKAWLYSKLMADRLDLVEKTLGKRTFWFLLLLYKKVLMCMLRILRITGFVVWAFFICKVLLSLY